ncbi:SdrD B-like domain-containing protein, partial [Vibrio alfacsensis]|uniref:SdrD B-like domain-containing protein n=1 Tax=Vibrio alfacsensis TaxID=1074311 RepID=UPI004067EC85
MQFSRFFQFTLGLFLYASYSSELKAATIELNGPSSEWLPILVGDRFDPVDDEQSQTSGLDLVGNAMHPSLYSQYDDKGTPEESDDEIGFRFRVGADSDDNVYLIGLDANHDGTVDLFISADSRGNTRAIALWGSGNCNQDLCNNGPSTTTIANKPTFTENYTADNYYFAPVSTLDSNVTDSDVGDLDGEDHFVSYKLRFENLNASLQQESRLQITKSTPIRYIAFSLTQTNAINGDFDGINDDTADTSKTFEDLGLFTPPLTADPSSSNNSISGVVFNDTDGDGVLDPGESGISEVTITLSGSTTDTTLTDNSGYYTFQFLNTGTYSVSETDPANAIAESGSANTVTDIALTGATLYTVNFADVLESANQAPVAQPQNVTIEEDTPLAITLSGSDVDGSIRSYDIVQ